MKVLTLLNEKGGVGKTTLTTHIGAGLAALGMRVMVIDADPQGHATIRLGATKAPMLYDLLVRDADWDQVTVKVPPEHFWFMDKPEQAGTLYLVASNIETKNIGGSVEYSTILAERLEELDELGMVDVVLIDTSPTPSLFHSTIYLATDAVIYPTELAFTSFDGLVESIKRRHSANNVRSKRWELPPMEILGIVPTKYRKGTSEQDGNLANLKVQFGAKVWPAIRLLTVWTETEAPARPVWQIEPGGQAASDFCAVLELVKDELYVTA